MEKKKNASISTKTELLSFNTIRTCGQLWSYSKVVYHVVALALFVNFFFFFENFIICKYSRSVKITNKNSESSCDKSYEFVCDNKSCGSKGTRQLNQVPFFFFFSYMNL